MSRRAVAGGRERRAVVIEAIAMIARIARNGVRAALAALVMMTIALAAPSNAEAQLGLN